MGGKIWSKDEEDVFWGQLIPHSPKRLGKDLENEEKSWDWVSSQMTEILGDGARRKYTHLCLFEHYFQNTALSRFSPNARKLPMKYWRHEQAIKEYKEGQKEMAKKRKAEDDLDSIEEIKGERDSHDEEEDVKTPAKSPKTAGKAFAATRTLNGEAKGEAIVKTESTGQEDSLIEIDCQYPTNPSSHGHAPVPPFTIPSSPRSFGLAASYLPQPQYHLHQSLANHDRLENTEIDQSDSLFVTQPSASWMGAVVPRNYGHHS